MRIVPSTAIPGAVWKGAAQGRSLWDRLHLFEAGFRAEAQQLDEALEEMGDTLPENDDDLRERCWRIENLLKHDGGKERLKTCVQDVRQCLGALMRVRYGPDPQIQGLTD